MTEPIELNQNDLAQFANFLSTMNLTERIEMPKVVYVEPTLGEKIGQVAGFVFAWVGKIASFAGFWMGVVALIKFGFMMSPLMWWALGLWATGTVINLIVLALIALAD